VSASGTSSDLAAKAAGGRKLIAVIYADMVGYSRLIGLDDAGTLHRLRTLRRALIDPAIREHGGRVVQTGTLEQMRQHTRTTITAVLTDDPAGVDVLPGVHDVRVDGRRLVCSVDADRIGAVIVELGRRDITSITVAPRKAARIPEQGASEDFSVHR